jgi:hypothetical protein
MEIATRIIPAKYFARMICISVSGRVRSNSIVPDFFSSAKERMVIAGMRKRKTHGPIEKSVSMLAYPTSRTLVPPRIIHMKSDMAKRKTTITMYPMRELRKLRISLTKSEYINLDGSKVTIRFTYY